MLDKRQLHRINEVETKSITVRVGSPVVKHPDKYLRTSLFNKLVLSRPPKINSREATKCIQ